MTLVWRSATCFCWSAVSVAPNSRWPRASVCWLAPEMICSGTWLTLRMVRSSAILVRLVASSAWADGEGDERQQRKREKGFVHGVELLRKIYAGS